MVSLYKMTRVTSGKMEVSCQMSMPVIDANPPRLVMSVNFLEPAMYMRGSLNMADTILRPSSCSEDSSQDMIVFFVFCGGAHMQSDSYY